MKKFTFLIPAFAIAGLALAGVSTTYSQGYYPPPPSPMDAPLAAQPAYTQQQLDQMLAPIALYPDPLLSQILMAATYPREVADAANWSRARPGLQGDAAVRYAEQQDWDPSVISLTAFPQILAMMAENMEWTEDLGEAFLAQQPQVMDTVQELRRQAYAAGNLRSNDQFRVESYGQQILVLPVNPQVFYLPYYDPTIVYGTWRWPAYPPVYWRPWPGYHVRPGYTSAFAWGSGIRISANFFFGGVDWRQRQVRVVNVNNYYYRPSVTRNTQDGRVTTNVTPGVWRFNAEHRRGAPYRAAQLQQHFGSAQQARPAAAPANVQPPRPDIRIERSGNFNGAYPPGARVNNFAPAAVPNSTVRTIAPTPPAPPAANTAGENRFQVQQRAMQTGQQRRFEDRAPERRIENVPQPQARPAAPAPQAAAAPRPENRERRAPPQAAAPQPRHEEHRAPPAHEEHHAEQHERK